MQKSCNNSDNNKVRLDKWLWAARFFKTRSLAVDAITGGKVHLNGQRVKPAKEIHIGDQLTVRTGFIERTVIIRALSVQRRPAGEAALLYEETADSIEKREKLAELHRQGAELRPRGSGRPTKRDRRAIHRFVRGDSTDEEK